MKIEKPKNSGELFNATVVGMAKSSAGFALADFKSAGHVFKTMPGG
jgi:hypothetical protein